ncbi:MAG: hypothetical protein ACKVU4_01670 [Phycisphaerales bacterium]
MIRTLLPALIVLAGVLLGVGRAQAQNDLPRAIVEAAALQPDQERELERWTSANMRMLEADDQGDMKKGREALIRPLTNRNASVSFRLKYSGLLAPTLGRLAQDANEPRAINALILCGWIATTQSALVLDQMLADPRTAVRYSAAAACGRTFAAVGGGSPAIAAVDAIGLVDRLGRQLADETDAFVLDRCVVSLIAAGQVARDGFGSLREQGLSVLATRAGERLRALPVGPDADKFLPSFVRAGGALRDAAANMQFNLHDDNVTRPIVKFGARAWAHVAQRLEAGQFEQIQPGDEPQVADAKRDARKVIVQLVQVGRGTMFFAATRLDAGSAFEPPEPVEWVAQADAKGDNQFVRRARELIGPGGQLTKPPFGYPASEFLPR